MTTTVGSNTSYRLTIPELSETADIQTAIKLIAYGQSADPTNNADIESNSLAGYISTKANASDVSLKANLAGPTFTGTVGVAGESSQFPVSLSLTEATHATSRRASIQLGLGWQIGQDSSGNGTKNFYIYQTSTELYPFTISPTNNISIGATGYTTTFTGAVVLPTGTNSVAPLKFNTGTTKLNTIQPGTVEYDGNIFYATPKVNNTTAGRGLIETPYLYVASSDTQVVISTAQSNGSGSGTTTDTDTASTFGRYIFLAANSTYMIEANVMLSHSFTDTSPSTPNGSGNITFGFQYPSGTTFSVDVSQIKDQANALSNPPTVASFADVNALLPYIYTQSTTDISLRNAVSTAATRYSMFRIRGIVRTSSTAGNFAPKLITTATTINDSDAQNSFVSRGNILKDSFIKVTPLGGTTSDVNIGGWA
jgi:hypothetical protein